MMTMTKTMMIIRMMLNVEPENWNILCCCLCCCTLTSSDPRVELHSDDDDDGNVEDDDDDGYICRPQVGHLDILQPLCEHQLLVDCHSQKLETVKMKQHSMMVTLICDLLYSHVI